MTASPIPNQGRGAGRIALIVVGACFALLALLPLGAGGVLIGVHSTQRDAAASTPPARTRSPLPPTRSSPNARRRNRWSQTGCSAREGSAPSASPLRARRRPIFIGIARQAQIDSYLHGVAHDEIKDFDLDPFKVRTVTSAGRIVSR